MFNAHQKGRVRKCGIPLFKLFSWENRIGPFGNVDRTIQRSVNGIITNGEVFKLFLSCMEIRLYSDKLV